MHPAGCFGSSLAYDAKSPVCSGCPKKTECSALVTGRRPAFLRVLDKFSDGQGRTMAWPWLTARERKVRRDKEKDLANPCFGLMSQINDRAHPTINTMAKLSVDPRSATLDELAEVTPQLGAVIEALKQAPQTVDGLTDAIARRCSLKASTAKRDAYALMSLLTTCNRAERDGSLIRLA